MDSTEEYEVEIVAGKTEVMDKCSVEE